MAGVIVDRHGLHICQFDIFQIAVVSLYGRKLGVRFCFVVGEVSHVLCIAGSVDLAFQISAGPDGHGYIDALAVGAVIHISSGGNDACFELVSLPAVAYRRVLGSCCRTDISFCFLPLEIRNGDVPVVPDGSGNGAPKVDVQGGGFRRCCVG